jgi:hypothetical protein
MKYLNKIIISFVGILFALVSCDSELPFPDAERATLVTFEQMDDLPFLTSVSDPDTEFKIGTSLHQFGGTQYAKVELCVVKNPAKDVYTTAVLSEITSGLSVDQPVVNTFKLSDIIAKTGGGSIEGGDQFAFYYNMYMPDGVKTTGWSKITGFPSDKSVNNVAGQVSYIRYNVVCLMDFSDLLGDWTVESPNFFGQTWDAVATEDPDKPGAGLVFTMLDNGSYPTPHPVKTGIDMATYKFTFAKQLFLDGPVPGRNAAYLKYTLGAASGDIGSCDLSISFSPAHTVTLGSFGAAPVRFKKK